MGTKIVFAHPHGYIAGDVIVNEVYSPCRVRWWQLWRPRWIITATIYVVMFVVDRFTVEVG